MSAHSKNPRAAVVKRPASNVGLLRERHGVGVTSQAEEGSLGKEQSGMVEVHTGYQDHGHTSLYS